MRDRTGVIYVGRDRTDSELSLASDNVLYQTLSEGLQGEKLTFAKAHMEFQSL